MCASGKRRRPVDTRKQLRLGRIADIVNCQPAIAPRAVAAISGRDHMMKRHPTACRHSRSLSGSAIHTGKPPTRDDLRLRGVLEIDNAKNMVCETVEMRRNVGVADTGPPKQIDPNAGHLQERDLLHCPRPGDVMNAET